MSKRAAHLIDPNERPAKTYRVAPVGGRRLLMSLGRDCWSRIIYYLRPIDKHCLGLAVVDLLEAMRSAVRRDIVEGLTRFFRFRSKDDAETDTPARTAAALVDLVETTPECAFSGHVLSMILRGVPVETKWYKLTILTREKGVTELAEKVMGAACVKERKKERSYHDGNTVVMVTVGPIRILATRKNYIKLTSNSWQNMDCVYGTHMGRAKLYVSNLDAFHYNETVREISLAPLVFSACHRVRKYIDELACALQLHFAAGVDVQLTWRNTGYQPNEAVNAAGGACPACDHIITDQNARHVLSMRLISEKGFTHCQNGTGNLAKHVEYYLAYPSFNARLDRWIELNGDPSKETN